MKTIQVRNVPDELHRALKARAAMEGRALSDYITPRTSSTSRS
jgi:antitoxin FitA